MKDDKKKRTDGKPLTLVWNGKRTKHPKQQRLNKFIEIN